MLYDKWWKNDITSQSARMSGMQFGVEEQKCTKKRSGTDNMANALGVVNIGGIFVVLLCGLAFAITIAIIEFCWKTSSLNTSSTGNNKLMQTSPNRRNSRRRSTSFKVRTRKSLCAEIAGTLVPYKFNYSNKTATCVSRKNVSKMRKTTVRSSNNEHNQTIECNMYDFQQDNAGEMEKPDEQESSVMINPLALPSKTSVASHKHWSHEKSKSSLGCENTYDNVPNNNCDFHDAPPDDNEEDDDNYFYRPSRSSSKYQDQCTSARKLKKNLNNSLPSIPPVVPPHANGGSLEERALSSHSHRVYVPSLDRY